MTVVRLAEIDAPEMSTTDGPGAKAALSGLVLGRVVVVEWSRRDRYGRILGAGLSGRQVD